MKLPEHHHIGDRKWIREQFEKLEQLTSKAHAHLVADQYSLAYIQAFELEPLPHKRDGIARRTANKRLRKYVLAKIEQPPTI